MPIAVWIGSAAAFSSRPPMSGTLAFSSASSTSTHPAPRGSSRSVPLMVRGAPLTWMSRVDRREPSAAGPVQSCTSTIVRWSPTKERAMSGSPSDGSWRSVRTRSPLGPPPTSTV